MLHARRINYTIDNRESDNRQHRDIDLDRSIPMHRYALRVDVDKLHLKGLYGRQIEATCIYCYESHRRRILRISLSICFNRFDIDLGMTLTLVLPILVGFMERVDVRRKLVNRRV